MPIMYEVDRIRDGRSFSSRYVVARQHDRIIYHMSASFQTPETGVEHQIKMPDVPRPDELPDEMDRRKSLVHLMPEADISQRFKEIAEKVIEEIDNQTDFSPEINVFDD